MELAQMFVRIGATGAEDTASKIKNVGQAVDDTARRSRSAGDAFDRGFRVPFLRVVAAADEMVMGIRLAGNVLGSISGIGIAAEYADISIQLEAITGNADKAARALEMFKQIGIATPFDTAEVARFGAQILMTTQDIGKTREQLTSLLDIAAFTGVRRAVMPRFMENLLQISASPVASRIDLKEMLRAAPSIGRIVGAGLGTGPLNGQEAITQLQSMSGQEAYQTILRGGEALAKGAAAARGLQSPLAFVANLFESISLIMEPTGRILLAILMPLGSWIKMLSDGLGWLNKMTLGFAGLVALFAAVYGSRNLLIGSMIAAILHTRRLTQAILGYSLAAKVVAGAGAAGRAGDVGGGLGAGTATQKGWRGIGKNLLHSFGPAIAGTGLAVGGAMMGGKWGDALSGAGTGATIGGIVGSIIPGLGTAFGTVIGGLMGGLASLVPHVIAQATSGSAVGAGSDPDKKRTNDLLEKIASNTSVQINGGGNRAQMAAEYTLARLAIGGFA